MTIEPTGPRSDGPRPQQTVPPVAQAKSAKNRQQDLSSAIDWGIIKAQALQRLNLGRMGSVSQPAQLVLPASERARAGSSKADAVQEAVAELHAAQAAGEVLPACSERLLDLVLRTALRRWKAWRKRAREQRRNLALITPTVGPREMFDLICARDEQVKFFTRLYTELEDQPEARLLLYVILEKGILFHETRLLAQELHVSNVHITNMKRRIVRLSHSIMSELTDARHAGGRS